MKRTDEEALARVLESREAREKKVKTFCDNRNHPLSDPRPGFSPLFTPHTNPTTPGKVVFIAPQILETGFCPLLGDDDDKFTQDFLPLIPLDVSVPIGCDTPIRDDYHTK